MDRDRNIDDSELFNVQNTVDNSVVGIDVNVPEIQLANTAWPKDSQITSLSDIKSLEECIAFRFTNGIRLFRGHESKKYNLESTIVRLAKSEMPNYSVQDLLEVELKGYEFFCKNVFREKWLNYKANKTDETLFKMSIGRHLGLPCRLIDVTASLEIAIWFAVNNSKYYNEDGEVILLVLDKNNIDVNEISPFDSNKDSYSHELFGATDSLCDLPLGERRRFRQNGHFIWTADNSLLNEQQAIETISSHIVRFTIPAHAKQSLAIELQRDVFIDNTYKSAIEEVTNFMKAEFHAKLN